MAILLRVWQINY